MTKLCPQYRYAAYRQGGIFMKKIQVTLKDGTYNMLTKYAEFKNLPIAKVVAILVEKFAPVSHTMILEDIIKGYEESAGENLDWANL